MKWLIPYSLCASLVIASSSVALAQDSGAVNQLRVYPESQITYDQDRMNLQQRYDVIEGNRLVFEFVTTNAGEVGNDMVAPEYICFEVAENAKRFRYKNKKIANNNGIYIQMCRCPDKGIMTITDGKITGRRLDDGSWNVEMDIRVVGRRSDKVYHFVKAGVFELTEREE